MGIGERCVGFALLRPSIKDMRRMDSAKELYGRGEGLGTRGIARLVAE